MGLGLGVCEAGGGIGGVEFADQPITDDAGGLGFGDFVGIDGEVVEEGVVDVGTVIFFEVALASGIGFTDEGGGGVSGDFVEVHDAFGALVGAADEADVDDIFEVLSDDVGAAADEDGVAEFGELEDSFGGAADEFPGGGVEAEEFFHGIGDTGDFVLGHELGDTGGEFAIFEDFTDEVFVEDSPAVGVWGVLGEPGGEVFGGGDTPCPGLAGQGDGGGDLEGGVEGGAGALQVAIDVALAPFEE
ncbi:MAG: hypothetical protein RI897_2716 [Verrucomicrobiota bacterium]